LPVASANKCGGVSARRLKNLYANKRDKQQTPGIWQKERNKKTNKQHTHDNVFVSTAWEWQTSSRRARDLFGLFRDSGLKLKHT